MKKQKNTSNQAAQKRISENRNRSHFSPATLEVARKNLKELELQSDEDFLIRAEMNKKLSAL